MDAFYNQFGDFLNQLIAVFPGDSDFLAYKTGLMLLQRTNPMLVVEQVHLHVTPFEDTIRKRDESFFLNHGFNEQLEDNDTLEQVIQKLKGLWAELTANNKEVVWTYTILLLDLAKRCIAK